MIILQLRWFIYFSSEERSIGHLTGQTKKIPIARLSIGNPYKSYYANSLNLPNEILAMRAESRLLEESWDEAMILHIVNIFLLESTFAISLSDVYFVLYLLAQIFLFGHRRSVIGFLPIRVNCLFFIRIMIIIICCCFS